MSLTSVPGAPLQCWLLRVLLLVPAHTARLRAPPCIARLQKLDRACAAIADTSLALQLFGVLWRLLGQLVAVESLVVVILRPKLLQQLHKLLARKAVSLSAALHRLGLISTQLLPGQGLAPLAHPALLCRAKRCLARAPTGLQMHCGQWACEPH